jgi:hypothetical protein
VNRKYYPCDFGISQKQDIYIGESKRFYRSFCDVSYVRFIRTPVETFLFTNTNI